MKTFDDWGAQEMAVVLKEAVQKRTPEEMEAYIDILRQRNIIQVNEGGKVIFTIHWDAELQVAIMRIMTRNLAEPDDDFISIVALEFTRQMQKELNPIEFGRMASVMTGLLRLIYPVFHGTHRDVYARYKQWEKENGN